MQKPTKWKETFSGLSWEQKNPTFYLYQRPNSIKYLKGLAKTGSVKCKGKTINRTIPKRFSGITKSKQVFYGKSVCVSRRLNSAKKKGS